MINGFRLRKVIPVWFVLLGLGLLASLCRADEKAYFKAGPLELNVPFQTGDVVYLFNALDRETKERSLVGAETTVFTVWNKVSGTLGMVTSATGAGTFFLGADINVLERVVNLGPLRVGGFGGYDSRNDAWMAGPKCSIQLW